MTNTTDLYTATDTKKVRELLIKEQQGLDLVTQLPLTKPCLDHAHNDEQFVRGVIDSSINSYIGHVENNFKRHIAWWSDLTVSELLRMIATYLERPVDTRYRHPKWLAKAQTEFNKLKESQKDKVLLAMTQDSCNNTDVVSSLKPADKQGDKPGAKPAAKRKALFKKLLASRKYSRDYVYDLIERSVNEN